jgi:hypothetical protein
MTDFQLDLEGGETPHLAPARQSAAMPQLELGDFDTARVVVTESGERVQQESLSSPHNPTGGTSV